MTKEQINITIAESLGWKHVRDINYRLVGSVPESHPQYNKSIDLRAEIYVPDYCNDLNAMHEVWCSLSPKQHQTFRHELLVIIAYAQENKEPHKGPCHSVCNATALQRAEAYLRTIGKWKEE